MERKKKNIPIKVRVIMGKLQGKRVTLLRFYQCFFRENQEGMRYKKNRLNFLNKEKIYTLNFIALLQSMKNYDGKISFSFKEINYNF